MRGRPARRDPRAASRDAVPARVDPQGGPPGARDRRRAARGSPPRGGARRCRRARHSPPRDADDVRTQFVFKTHTSFAPLPVHLHLTGVLPPCRPAARRAPRAARPAAQQNYPRGRGGRRPSHATAPSTTPSTVPPSRDGPESAIAAVRRRVPAGALIVVPWGERGAWASAPGAGESWVCFPGHAPLSGPVVDTIGAGDTFIGAVLAYAALEPAAAALARGECVARTEGVLRAWLGFACCVAGEKCSQHGNTIGASGAESVRAAFRARWAEAAAAT